MDTYEQQIEIIQFHDAKMLQYRKVSEKQAFSLSREIIQRRGSRWLRLWKEYNKTISFYRKEIERLKNRNDNRSMIELQEIEADFLLEKDFFKSEFDSLDRSYQERYGNRSIWTCLQKK